MRTPPWRLIAGTIVLTATIGAFVYYFVQHPSVREQLRQTSLLTLGVLLFLYVIFVGCLALMNSATLRLCRAHLAAKESLLLTMYSSIVNFFGPLQSGPAFRAVYVKKKHQVKLRNYTAATVAYYLFYAFFSGIFLLSGLLHWWLAVIIAAGLLVLTGLSKSRLPFVNRFRQLDLSAWYWLAGATLLQVCVLAVIYFVEIHSVMPDVTVGQVIVYTGAANFALFVSLTPGAIGFRESFLVFSQQLHHIDTATIIVANTIDRAVYVLLLSILMVVIIATHARDRLGLAVKP